MYPPFLEKNTKKTEYLFFFSKNSGKDLPLKTKRKLPSF